MREKGPLWSLWECKLRSGNIVIYDVIVPPELPPSVLVPSDVRKHLRIVPTWPNGPFQLEWMRHTGRWWPLFDARGTMEQIANEITKGAGPTRPLDQHVWESRRRAT